MWLIYFCSFNSMIATELYSTKKNVENKKPTYSNNYMMEYTQIGDYDYDYDYDYLQQHLNKKSDESSSESSSESSNKFLI